MNIITIIDFETKILDFYKNSIKIYEQILDNAPDNIQDFNDLEWYAYNYIEEAYSVYRTYVYGAYKNDITISEIISSIVDEYEYYASANNETPCVEFKAGFNFCKMLLIYINSLI